MPPAVQNVARIIRAYSVGVGLSGSMFSSLFYPLPDPPSGKSLLGGMSYRHPHARQSLAPSYVQKVLSAAESEE